MKLFIPKDIFNNPQPPRVFLCTTGKKIIGQLPAYDISLDGKWGTYAELSFSIDCRYTDVLTGKTAIHPLFDKTEGLRKVYAENIGYFIIQDPDMTYGENELKRLSCFSSEYETANKYLENFRINTGDIDSKEVIALESIHGYNYTIDKDNLYTLASGEYDIYQSYYIMEYTDNDSYIYKQISVEEDVYNDYIIKNRDPSSQRHERLYISNYPNIRLYWPTRPELSLLHIILEKIPGWKIGNVDVNLWRKERTFDENRIAVYDFLMNKVQDTFKCVVEWDTITNTINVYEEAEDGITEDNAVQARWETDVFISRDNLASEININYSTDDIKTKLKVSGADDLDIREVNLGKNYIMNLDYYHTLNWMEQDLFERYDDYLEAVKEYGPQYTKIVQNWVGAYNKWNDLMNAVPADGNVVLIGDPFKKLYCAYNPINNTNIPAFEDIDNKQFISKFTACAQTWIDAATRGDVVYGSLSTDEKDYMAIRINPMLYATHTKEGFDVEAYRNIYEEAKLYKETGEGDHPSVNCITLCNMILMGIPYESSRLCNDENIIGASGYGFDIYKLSSENTKLDINTFTKILTQSSFFDTYGNYGLTKTVKSSSTADDGDIWYDEIRPGDIMYDGKHSMFCLNVEDITDGVKITFVDASTTHEPNIMISSFTVTSSKSERPIIRVARPYYSHYLGNEIQTSNLKALIDKLSLYHVNQDIEANQTDNYLLRLRNENSDLATIRIYNANETGTDVERKANPDYKIQVIIVYAQNGITSAPKTYTMEEWINGKLTAEYMGLEGYTVQYIGIMGAYFVLAKDETKEATLEEYGINLLKEKHDTYTTIFQAQTEAMLSQEKYQCIVQEDQPEGNYDDGTRWLDTNSSPVVLKELDGGQWKEISAKISEVDQMNYENYQRYIDNYEKMVAVQNVLLKKEKEAAYIRDGFAISGRNINIDLYTREFDDNKDGKIDNEDYLRYNGQSLEGDMERIAKAYFAGYTVTRQSMDQELPIYYFTTSFDPIIYSRNTGEFKENTEYYIKVMNKSDITIYQKIVIENQSVFDSYDGSTDDKTLYVITSGHVFAIYLKGTTPYIAYASSQGVYQTKMDWISEKIDFENFFTEDQWIRLSPFIREDEFSDSNFLLTGYESEEQRLEICKELFESANKELNTLCRPSLEFSMNMANILALPEFKPLIDQFQLGNFVRVHIRDGYVKRARLLEVHLSFDDLSDFSCNFGNLVTTKSEVDKHAELLSQAVTAGKQVAASSGDWQKAVDKSNKLEQDISSGLQDATLEIGRATGQSIVWDEHGIWGRKLIDGTTDQYDPEQFRIINNKLIFSNDGFKTSKAVFGSYTVNGETRWGPLAEYVTADTIEGKLIKGGSIEIGTGDTKFIVKEDGNVEIQVGGEDKYASTSALKEIDSAYRFQTILLYDKSTVFSDREQDCTITCTVYEYGKDITSEVVAIGGKFSWMRVSSDSEKDTVWNSNHIQTGENANKVTLKVDDVEGNSQFLCSVDFDETKLKTKT